MKNARVALSVGHPRGTHSRYVIGCCLIPLGICGLKNNSRRIAYGIGCVWRMLSLSPLSSLAEIKPQIGWAAKAQCGRAGEKIVVRGAWKSSIKEAEERGRTWRLYRFMVEWASFKRCFLFFGRRLLTSTQCTSINFYVLFTIQTSISAFRTSINLLFGHQRELSWL